MGLLWWATLAQGLHTALSKMLPPTLPSSRLSFTLRQTWIVICWLPGFLGLLPHFCSQVEISLFISSCAHLLCPIEIPPALDSLSCCLHGSRVIRDWKEELYLPAINEKVWHNGCSGTIVCLCVDKLPNFSEPVFLSIKMKVITTFYNIVGAMRND